MRVTAFRNRWLLLTHALDVARDGLAVEFGVAGGRSLRHIAARRPGRTFGFDSFDGLPENWRPGFAKGRFAGQVPDVPGAEIVVGMFDATLPVWLARHRVSEIGLVHIDSDLYESARTVLQYMTGLHPGTVLVFDELVGYPGWPGHEHHALLQWVAATRTWLEPIGHVSGGEQVGFQVVERWTP